MKSTRLSSAKATAASRSDDRQLGLGHLQLGKRAFNQCTEQGCRTIADVEARYASGHLTSDAIGEKTGNEVGSALETFRQLINENGQVDWEAFRVARPVVLHRVTITSHRFKDLAPSVLNSKIEILHLKKAMLGLEKAGLVTVGSLIKAAHKGITDLKSFGPRAKWEVAMALTALPDAILADGTLDWARDSTLRHGRSGPDSATDSNRTSDDFKLGLDHLQLSQRPYNRCVEVGCSTIADVEAGYASGHLSRERVGKKTGEEIELALNAFYGSMDKDNRVDWEAFRALVPMAAHRIAFTSHRFEKLSPSELDSHISILHLKKAVLGLKSEGIHTLGDLIKAARCGIDNLRSFGPRAYGEVTKALSALAYAILPDGTVDWIQFAKRCDLLIVPGVEMDPLTSETLLKRLPGICRAIIRRQFNDRAWTIFQERWLAPEADRLSLESIGSRFDLTRERVRQIEERGLGAMTRAMFKDDYRGLNFRLQKELSVFFIRAKAHFYESGHPAWRRSTWRSELAEFWDVRKADLVRYERLVMALLGFEERRFDNEDLELLVFDAKTSDKECTRVMNLVETLHNILSESNVGFSSNAIARTLKKSAVGFKGSEEIPAILNLCSTVERIGRDQYRLQFQYLKGRAEQVFRVMYDHGKPMHRSELLRELNKHLVPAERLQSEGTLVNQLATDSRIVPIGKSGKWTLKEWGYETRSLVDLIEEVLADALKPMTRNDIVAAVASRRSHGSNSVMILLSTHPERFRRVGPDMYGLTTWEDSIYDGPIWDKDAVGRFITDFFATHKTDTVGFKVLSEAFARESALARSSARKLLVFHPAIIPDGRNSWGRIVRYNKDWQTLHGRRRSSKRKLQTERIVSAFRKKLLAEPSGQLQLSHLVQDVEAELKVPRASIYSAISKSDEIVTAPMDGSILKICRLRD